MNNNKKYIIYDYNNGTILTRYSSDFNKLEWNAWLEDVEIKTKNIDCKPFTLSNEDNVKQFVNQISSFLVREKLLPIEEVDIRYLCVQEKISYMLANKDLFALYGWK
jgi:ABC-type phosphonate transport system ATPase subunit